ncbi:hypothetical protein [Halorussus marinus]|uniref:hypothetical protein n=1 Tax=Halorussus marinus TaxID=2505976 RepID=UPI001431FD19|nr:hypothetical protein [Halorussus marinus]
MAWNDTDLSRAAALAGIVIVVCAFTSGAYTYGLLSDQESTTVSITADFEPTTTPDPPGRNVVATTSCHTVTLENEGKGNVIVQIERVDDRVIWVGTVHHKVKTRATLPAGEYELTAGRGIGWLGEKKAGKKPSWTVNGKKVATLTVSECRAEESNSDDDASSATAFGSSSVAETEDTPTPTTAPDESGNETVRETAETTTAPTTTATNETTVTETATTTDATPNETTTPTTVANETTTTESETTTTTTENETTTTTTTESETTTATETPQSTTANRTTTETTTTTETET